MIDEDSLVATRARRINAGSRLKQLIELEEQASHLQSSISQIITEDDENVNLLFQEDENDKEFFDEEVDNENLIGIDDDDDDEEDEEGEDAEVDEEDGNQERVGKRKRENDDDVLSDSDISASDSNESEGEKELEKQEKLKKKRVKKNIIPTIKKANVPKPKVSKVGLITSDSLMLSVRRSSSRAAAVENKQALVQKLKENEARRAKLSPVVRVKHIDLTQEEKLAEAVETEKANVLSLMLFREQEVFKKERQRQLLLLKRAILKNVVRIVSKETFISPTEEIKEARRIHEIMYNKSKRKPGRRRKILPDQPEPVIKIPGDIDMELPWVKQEMEKKRKEEEEQLAADELQRKKDIEAGIIQETEVGDNDNTALEMPGENEEGTIDRPLAETKELLQEVSLPGESSIPPISATGENESQENIETIGLSNTSLSGINDVENKSSAENITEEDGESKANSQESVEVQSPVPGTTEVLSEISEKDVSVPNDSLPSNDIASNTTDPNPDDNVTEVEVETQELKVETSEEIKTEDNGDAVVKEEPEDNDPSLKEEKKVKFADELESEHPESEQPETRENTPGAEGTSESGEIFEGPMQRIAQNTIYLIDFDERIDLQKAKAAIFGEQALLPASRRFKDLKTILHIGKVDAYATIKPERDILLEPVTELSEDDPIFDDLKKLPRLGVKQTIIEDIKQDVETETTSIVLKTEAPTGLYLPNGNKKNCLMSGTEVKYFDPSNGIPYSSVETYKLLKSIEQGLIPWLSIGSDVDDIGSVEIYLGSRDSVRHANGVPEGFDS